jgi:RNA polymerase sigma-70 factor (ECF subfamily)
MNIEKNFTEIYNTHAPKVYRLCLGYASGDVELAKEWQQQTFIKVWTHRNSFKGKSTVNTWIYRIALNICLGNLRKSKKKTPIQDNISTSTSSVTDEKTHHDNIAKMYSCINQLTEDNKTLILLELEEIPQATIAETLGMKHNAVRTRLSRIRKTLLKCIKNEK